MNRPPPSRFAGVLLLTKEEKLIGFYSCFSFPGFGGEII
jgi:hypothetical protein